MLAAMSLGLSMHEWGDDYDDNAVVLAFVEARIPYLFVLDVAFGLMQACNT